MKLKVSRQSFLGMHMILAVVWTELLLVVFEWVDIDVMKKLVGFCVDGDNVDLGKAGGVAVWLAREIPAPWLVVMQ